MLLLREKCLYSEFFWSVFSRVWTEYGDLHAFFIINGFFQLSLSVAQLFHGLSFKLLLSCCLIHIVIIILRHIFYLVYLCPCPGLGLFESYLWDQFFIPSLIFIVINYITSFKLTSLIFVHFLKNLPLFWIITWMKKSKKFENTFSLKMLLSAFA